MHYVLHYGQITSYLPYFIEGALLSLELSVLAFSAGLILAFALAILRNDGGPIASRLVRGYVAFFTNTPQLVQIYVIFFGLPDLGILFSPFAAVLIGMTLNAAAYLTEIVRAGLASVHQQELDAAETLGMGRLQTLRYVILPHVFQVSMPPLSNQYILMTLGTSMAAVFGVEELTGRAINISTVNLRTIETFSIVAAIYVALTFIASIALGLVGRHLFRAKIKVF